MDHTVWCNKTAYKCKPENMLRAYSNPSKMSYLNYKMASRNVWISIADWLATRYKTDVDVFQGPVSRLINHLRSYCRVKSQIFIEFYIFVLYYKGFITRKILIFVYNHILFVYLNFLRHLWRTSRSPKNLSPWMYHKPDILKTSLGDGCGFFGPDQGSENLRK